MTDQTVVAFPGRPSRSSVGDVGFADWRAWTECEIAILGFDMRGQSSFGFPVSGSNYDWREAFERGLSPQEAASEAATLFATP